MSFLRLLLLLSDSFLPWGVMVGGAVLEVAWALLLRIFFRASCPRFSSASRSMGVLVGLVEIAVLGREGVGGFGPSWPPCGFPAIPVVVCTCFSRFSLSRAAFPLRLSSSLSIVGLAVGFGGGFAGDFAGGFAGAFGLMIGVETFGGATAGFGMVGFGGGLGVTFIGAFVEVPDLVPFPTSDSILPAVGSSFAPDSLLPDSATVETNVSSSLFNV